MPGACWERQAKEEQAAGGRDHSHAFRAGQAAATEPDEQGEQAHAAGRGGLHQRERREAQRSDVERPPAQARDEARQPLPVREQG